MESPAPDPSFLHAEPQLFVTDLAKAMSFYVDKFGFEIAFSYGQPVNYAQVIRGGVRLNLRQSQRMPFDRQFCELTRDALSATIAVDNAEAAFAEMSARGALFHRRLMTEDWGSQTFIVRDPDGNLICFAGS
jgi:uncharacterized glyoxalase superfamily protein PhnB